MHGRNRLVLAFLFRKSCCVNVRNKLPHAPLYVLSLVVWLTRISFSSPSATVDVQLWAVRAMSDLASRVKQYGLTQVYCSPEKPLVDIVFVHGLNGHPYNTWASSNGTFWPADLLPEILGPNRVRILTYGYNANVTAFTDGASKDRIHNHAETLASGLAANRNVSGRL